MAGQSHVSPTQASIELAAGSARKLRSMMFLVTAKRLSRENKVKVEAV